MPRPRLTMRKVRDVLRLALGEDLSLRQVGASLASPSPPWPTTCAGPTRPGSAGRCPTTSTTTPSRRCSSRTAAPRPRSASRPDWALVHRELRRYRSDPDVVVARVQRGLPRRLRLQPVLLSLPPVGSATSTWSCARSTGPARSCFVDFAGTTIPIYDRASRGVAFEAELFVAVLGASSYLYAEALRLPGAAPLGRPPTCTPSSSSGACPAVVVLRQPALGGHQGPPLRARRQRHLPGDGRPLRRGHHPGADLQAPRQGQGRSRGAAGRALDHRPAAQPALHQPGRGQRGHRRAPEWINERPFKKLDGSRRSSSRTFDRPALRPLPPTATSSPPGARPRSTSTTTSRSTEPTTTRSPTGWSARSSTCGCRQATVEVFFRTAGWPPTCAATARGYSTDPAHMPESHRRHAEWTPVRIIGWAEKTGPVDRGAGRRRSWRPAPIPNRASLRARASSAWPTATARSAWRRPVPGRCAARAFSLQLRRVDPAHGLDRQPLTERPPASPSPPRQPPRPGLLPLKGDAPCSPPPPSRDSTPSSSRPWPPAWSNSASIPTTRRSASRNGSGLLVDRELTERENRRLERTSSRPSCACAAVVEDIDFRRQRGLDRPRCCAWPRPPG